MIKSCSHTGQPRIAQMTVNLVYIDAFVKFRSAVSLLRVLSLQLKLVRVQYVL